MLSRCWHDAPTPTPTKRVTPPPAGSGDAVGVPPRADQNARDDAILQKLDEILALLRTVQQVAERDDGKDQS